MKPYTCTGCSIIVQMHEPIYVVDKQWHSATELSYVHILSALKLIIVCSLRTIHLLSSAYLPVIKYVTEITRWVNRMVSTVWHTWNLVHTGMYYVCSSFSPLLVNGAL